MSTRLDEYLTTATEDLPTIPTVASQVMQAVESAESSVDDIRKVIDQDPALAARILKLANSSLFGFRAEIGSLRQAIALLGLRTVRNLVLAVSMKQTYRQFGLMEKLLCEHSTLAGPVAAKLAKETSFAIEADEAFTAGLLHDVGKVALANSHRDEYEQVVTRVYNENMSFVEAEKSHFGFDHSEIGARVAGKWGLPERLISAICYHHDLERLSALPVADARLIALTAVTSACLTKLGVGRRKPVVELDLAAHPAWLFLGLAEKDVEPILEICKVQVASGRSLTD